jgi:hypothetical protein
VGRSEYGAGLSPALAARTVRRVLVVFDTHFLLDYPLTFVVYGMKLFAGCFSKTSSLAGGWTMKNRWSQGGINEVRIFQWRG